MAPTKCSVIVTLCCIISACQTFKPSPGNEAQLDVLVEKNEKWINKVRNALPSEERVKFLAKLEANGVNLEEAKNNSGVDRVTSQWSSIVDVKITCSIFIKYLTKPMLSFVNDYNGIYDIAYHPFTEAENKVYSEKLKKQLASNFDKLNAGIKDDKKKQLARTFLPACEEVVLFMSRFVREGHYMYEPQQYVVQDSSIIMNAKPYLTWLNKTEIARLSTMVEKEGAPLRKLRTTIGNIFVNAYGMQGGRLNRVPDVLRKGCVALAEHFLGKKKAGTFIKIVEHGAAKQRELAHKSHMKESQFYFGTMNYQYKMMWLELQGLINGLYSEYRIMARFFLGLPELRGMANSMIPEEMLNDTSCMSFEEQRDLFAIIKSKETRENFHGFNELLAGKGTASTSENAKNFLGSCVGVLTAAYHEAASSKKSKAPFDFQ